MSEITKTKNASLEETWPESQWYTMLFPSQDESERIAAQLAELAERTGGTVYPNIHVTVGYFGGNATVDSVVSLARELDRPQIAVKAAGLFSWSESRHPLDGYSLSLQVIRDAALRNWQRRAQLTLVGAGLVPTFPWEDQNPHVAILRELPVPPAEVLVRLGSQDVAVEFRAVRLVVSHRVGDSFVTLLDQPLES
jgi:hypothetical protein